MRVLIASLALAFAFAANAHTKLSATSPAAEASVAAPKTLELTFSGDVRLTSVALTDAAGIAKHLDAVPTAVAKTFSLAVHEPLAPGAYKVTWRAVGGDTHVVSGEFGFTVAAAHAH